MPELSRMLHQPTQVSGILFGASFESVATELLLAENANIANLIFRNQRLESSATSNGVPNFFIDGFNNIASFAAGNVAFDKTGAKIGWLRVVGKDLIGYDDNGITRLRLTPDALPPSHRGQRNLLMCQVAAAIVMSRPRLTKTNHSMRKNLCINTQIVMMAILMMMVQCLVGLTSTFPPLQRHCICPICNLVSWMPKVYQDSTFHQMFKYTHRLNTRMATQSVRWICQTEMPKSQSRQPER